MKVKVLNNFILGKNHLGKAVFAGRIFKKGDVVVKFEGEIINQKDVPKKLKGEYDRYVQIGSDIYLGPSNEIDDFINHSCKPNTGLSFSPAGIFLVAIKNIKIGDEITWDYSTTLFNNTWKMLCDCKTKECRKIISDFILLNPKIQKKYQKLKILPPYILDYMKSSEYLVYTKGIQSLKKNERK